MNKFIVVYPEDYTTRGYIYEGYTQYINIDSIINLHHYTASQQTMGNIYCDVEKYIAKVQFGDKVLDFLISEKDYKALLKLRKGNEKWNQY